MTRNSRLKSVIRDYQDKRPAVTYPEAKRIVLEAWSLMKSAGVSFDEAIELVEAKAKMPAQTPVEVILRLLREALERDNRFVPFAVDVETAKLEEFPLSLPDEIDEWPVDVDGAEVDTTTLEIDIAEEFEYGAFIGEAHVQATVTWSAGIHKSTFLSDSDSDDWQLVDDDWNKHYVIVQGKVATTLTYEFQVTVDLECLDNLVLRTFK